MRVLNNHDMFDPFWLEVSAVSFGAQFPFSKLRTNKNLSIVWRMRLGEKNIPLPFCQPLSLEVPDGQEQQEGVGASTSCGSAVWVSELDRKESSSVSLGA